MNSRCRALVLGVLMGFACHASGDEPAVIPAADANEHVGKVCCVEFIVKSTGRIKARQGLLTFLNSERNSHAEENVAIVIDDSTAGKFAAAGIRNVEKHFVGKQVRVTGQVNTYNQISEIRIADPRQIKIVDANPPVDPAETPPPPELQPDNFDPRPRFVLPYIVVGVSVVLLAVGLVVRKVQQRQADS
jgi:hypothetical protein